MRKHKKVIHHQSTHGFKWPRRSYIWLPFILVGTAASLFALTLLFPSITQRLLHPEEELKSVLGVSTLKREEVVTGTASTDGASSVSSGTINGGSKLLYIAAVSTKPNVTVGSVSGLGLSWNRAAAQCGGRGQTRTEVWWAYGSPSQGGSVTALFTNSSKNKAAVLIVTSYSGSSGNPIANATSRNSIGVGDSSCSGGSDLGSYSLSVNAANANSILFGAIGLRQQSHSPGNSFTEINETHTSRGVGDDAGLAIVDKSVSTAGSQDVQGSFGSAVDYSVVGLEIVPGQSLEPTSTPTPAETSTPTQTKSITPTPSNTATPTLSQNATPTPTVQSDAIPTPTSPPETTTVAPTSTTGSTEIPGIGYAWGPFRPNETLLELQGWWTPQPTDDGKGFGHIHVLCWWPMGRKVKDVFPDGIIKTDCRITLHSNPSTFKEIRFDLAPGDTVAHFTDLAGATCRYDGVNPTNCSWNQHIVWDTNNLYDGWIHLRLRATVRTADGKIWTTSSEIPLQTGDSSNVRDSGFSRCLKNCSIGKSWYEGFDYQRVKITNIPERIINDSSYTFSVLALKGTFSTQRLLVILDRSHTIPAVGPWPAEPNLPTGPILLDITNPTIGVSYPVTINTGALVNGWHSFAVRSIEATGGTISPCPYSTGCTSPGFQTAVEKIWFYVQH